MKRSTLSLGSGLALLLAGLAAPVMHAAVGSGLDLQQLDKGLLPRRIATSPALREVRGGQNPGRSGPRRPGMGWTVRQVQRMARKARNRARHKAHCKGGR